MAQEVYALSQRLAAAQGFELETLDRDAREEIEEQAREALAVDVMTRGQGKFEKRTPLAEQVAGVLGITTFEARRLMARPRVQTMAQQAVATLATLIAVDAAESFCDSMDKLKSLGDNAESETVQLGAHSERAKLSLDALKFSAASKRSEGADTGPSSVTVNVNTQNNHGLGPLQELPPGGIRGG